MDAASATTIPRTTGGSLSATPPLLRLMHTALDGTVESFVNIYDNLAERLSIKPRATFSEDLSGKVAIVTGGNAGIGFATAQQLARRGAHVVIACRDAGRAEAAVQAIARSSPASSSTSSSSSSSPSPPAPPPRVEAMPLDLGRLASVRAFAEAWRNRGLPLHLLVCNAGVMGPPKRLETADGLEMQFQVNFLSHWLLANLLLGSERERRKALTAAPPPRTAAAATSATAGAGGAASKPASATAAPLALSLHAFAGGAGVGAAGAAVPAGGEEEATRVVMVTSLTHRAGPLQWADKQSLHSYEPFLSYGLSKLANILTAKELQRRFDRSRGLGRDTAVAVHPGLVSTDLANGFFRGVSTGWAAGTPLQPLVEGAVRGASHVIGPLLMRSPEQSAAVMLHACLAPPAAVAGRYLALGRPAQPDQAGPAGLPRFPNAALWAQQQYESSPQSQPHPSHLPMYGALGPGACYAPSAASNASAFAAAGCAAGAATAAAAITTDLGAMDLDLDRLAEECMELIGETGNLLDASGIGWAPDGPPDWPPSVVNGWLDTAKRACHQQNDRDRQPVQTSPGAVGAGAVVGVAAPAQVAPGLLGGDLLRPTPMAQRGGGGSRGSGGEADGTPGGSCADELWSMYFGPMEPAGGQVALGHSPDPGQGCSLGGAGSPAGSQGGHAPALTLPSFDGCTAGWAHDSADATRLRLLHHPRLRELVDAVVGCRKVVVRSREAADELDAARDAALRDLNKMRAQARSSGAVPPGYDPALDLAVNQYIDLCEAYQAELTPLFKEAEVLMQDFETRLSSALQRGADASARITMPSSSGADAGALVSAGADPLLGGGGGEDLELRTVLKRKYTAQIRQLQEEFSKRKKIGKLPEDATSVLKQWWAANFAWPYPGEDVKRQLGAAAGLNATQINNWFINQRKRHWHKLFLGRQPASKEEAEVMLRKMKLIP
ncbi:hypothetical protein GPECTOR_2g991 [Gonium pectorale]|uniref:Homeobox domain-containing protein n=1 Tax=Gonium pectorale TaxID=33097 RepID=A0A150H1U6_GONPE|nr:hypothetical protein GPECTOR_2g991 [Gonium pectorale]|eukprot:KXZ56109.1 hypothetical protein GPECTOR_2g991 [Gonium pectorale]